VVNTLYTRPEHICHYWIEDEPKQCLYWDVDNTICTYEEEIVVEGLSIISRAPMYPLCNYLGTAKYKCPKYSLPEASDELKEDDSLFEARCVLPDPYRYVSKTPLCADRFINPATPLDYSAINGYNNGKCDGKGTDVTCSGFSASHLAMSSSPIDSSCTLNTAAEESTTLELPMSLEIQNRRALLGICRWWVENSDTEIKMSIASTKEAFVYEYPHFACLHDKVDKEIFGEVYYDEELKYYRPPCNGAMPDCPYYTGTLSTSTNCLPYISNVYLRDYDKVLAEQILELRYNIRKETWSSQAYDDLFGDTAVLYSFSSKRPEVLVGSDGIILDYSIEVTKVSIDDFKCFEIKKIPDLLTRGTVSNNLKPNYPTLIEEIKKIPLRPIIHSKFYSRTLDSTTTYDADVQNEYIFETSNIAHKFITIVAETPSMDEERFAINVSDPALAFPFHELLQYDSMYEYLNTLGINFKLFYDDFVAYLKFIKVTMPNKIFYTLFSETTAFCADVETIFGDNTILVLDNNTGFYEFDKITINKTYCSGVIIQNTFDVSNKSSEVDYLENYERFGCNKDYNPEITFRFMPLFNATSGGSIPERLFLDTRYRNKVGYREYKVKIFDDGYSVFSSCSNNDTSQFFLLGNSGEILVILDDAGRLHSLIKPWDYGNSIVLQGETAEGEEIIIDMVVVKYCTETLEDNQLIIKPKKPDKYRRLYKASIIFKKGIVIFERYSFGEKPYDCISYEEIENPEVHVDTYTKVQGSKGMYSMTSIARAPLVVSILFRGKVTGRIKGQVKTELLVWIRQPFCGDVEIHYQWSASYKEYKLLPMGGPAIADFIGLAFDQVTTNGYSPPCGDHYGGFMWYPYDNCEPFASYTIHTLTEADNAPMEMWLKGKKLWLKNNPHNSYDMRMLGPSDNYGWVFDVRTNVWDCYLDYRYKNSIRSSDIWFSGYANEVGGLEGADYLRLVEDGGMPPKFGNKHRDYILSYVTSDHLLYYLRDPASLAYHAFTKWIPIPQGFTDLNINNGFLDYPWKYFFNSHDLVQTYFSQKGIITAVSMEGVSVKEKIYMEEGKPKRFRFDEVFTTHLDVSKFPQASPIPKIQYFYGTFYIFSWYNYRKLDFTSKAIQWVWREIWKPFERGSIELTPEYIRSLDFSEEDIKNYMDSYLPIVDIHYLGYTYNMKNKEFRRTIEEDTHTLEWEASIFDEEHPLPPYFLLYLDGGPPRLFDAYLNLITDKESIPEDINFNSIDYDGLYKAIDFYDICSSQMWLNDINTDMSMERPLPEIFSGFVLYDGTTVIVDSEEKAIKNAQDADREVKIFNSAGSAEYYYYNTGLYININFSNINYIPFDYIKLEPYDYEFSLSTPSHDEGSFSEILPNDFVPGSVGFTMAFYDELGTSDVLFTFKLSKLRVIGRLSIVYYYGITKDITNKEIIYNNIPEIWVRSEDGTLLIHEYFELATGSNKTFKKLYVIDIPILELMTRRGEFFYITMRYKPTVKELSNIELEPGFNYKHHVSLVSIEIEYIEYKDAVEVFNTYERKYLISLGDYGDIPMEGSVDDAKVFTTDFRRDELSGCRQWDTYTGMWGEPGSFSSFKSTGKFFSRVVDDIRPPKKPLSEDYTVLEQRQKQLYDTTIKKGTKLRSYKSIMHILYKDAFKQYNVYVFPRWSLNMTNTSLVPLKAVESKSKYNPQGHLYYWENFHPGTTNCYGYTTFGYVWHRVSDPSMGASYAPTYITITSHSAMMHVGGFTYVGQKMGFIP
jgi:hypothetical protein